MPLIKPEIQRVLRSSGLVPEASEGSLSEKLDRAGLSDDELAEELVGLAKHSGNESLRLRALEIAAKLKGALKDAPPSIPSFNITIQSCEPSAPVRSENPILFPRPAGARID